MDELSCVRAEDLRAFLLGKLSDGQVQAITRHLEICPDCEAAASRLDDVSDPVVRSLRRILRPPQAPAATTPLCSPAPEASAGETVASAEGKPSSLPCQVAGYELLEELGRGGMGVVYRARQTHPARLVALKMIMAGTHAGAEERARFFAEADAIARLSHPNIIHVYEVGQHEGVPFFSLEYLDGGNLAQKLAGQPQLPRQAAALVKTLAGAVHCAHQQGVVHRDLKPANVLLASDGTVKIADFGLAKHAAESGLTMTGAVMGTPGYMAPEQARGDNQGVGPAADVYALGAILYELLTGRPPFKGASNRATLEMVCSQQPVAPSLLQPRLPRDLETICLACLRKEPHRRYATAAALADDLGRFLEDRAIVARAVSAPERAWRWARRNPAWAGMLTTVLALLLVIAVGASVLSLRLSNALTVSDGRKNRAEEAERDANSRLWGSHLAEARATWMTRQPGQRFQSLRAIGMALRLPLPPDRSLDELRTATIAALCVPDLEVAKEWEGSFQGLTRFSIDAAFERYAWSDMYGNVSVRRIEGDVELFKLGANTPGGVFGYAQFSPDSRFLHQTTVVNQQARCRLWRIDGLRAKIAIPDDDHVSVTFRPDSQRLAAAYPDGMIRIFDVAKGREVKRFAGGLRGGPQEPHVRWSPRHDQIAVFTESEVRVLDTETGKIVFRKSFEKGLYTLDWHPNGNVIAFAGWSDWLIRLWDIRTDRLASPPLRGHKTFGIVVRFNHAGTRLVSNDWSGLMRLWDVRTGRQLMAQPVGDMCLQFSRDDSLLAADVTPSRIRLFRYRDGQEFRTVTDHYPWNEVDNRSMAPVCVHPQGRLMAIQSTSGILLEDLARGEEVALLRLPGRNPPLRFDPADGSLWTYGSNGVLRWPIRAPAGKPQHLLVGPPQRLARLTTVEMWGSSLDGKVIAIPNYSRGALLWQRDLNRVLPLGPQSDVRCCSVSPDGRWVATGSMPGEGALAKVWDGRSGKHVADLKAETGCSLGFSPDGKWLLTSSGVVRLLEVGSWREARTFGHNARFAFSADGKLLALGDNSNPGVVRLVAPETGKEVARLTGPEPTRLNPWCFTPDGGHLITSGSESREVHIFDLRAIRKQLKERGLDWDAPPIPEAPGARPEPLRVEVELGVIEADRLMALARRLASQKKHKESLAALRQAIEADPSHAMAHNNQAWSLVTGPKELRDPKAALPLARKAMELGPSDNYRNTLGVVYYRLGRFGDASGCFEANLKKPGPSAGTDLLFLAMCQHRLGETAHARESLKRAIAWRKAQTSLAAEAVKELDAFTAEARAVLGMPAAPK